MSASDTATPDADPADDPSEPLDARLLVPAAAGWLAAVFLVGQRPLAGLITASIALPVAVVLSLFLRRRRRLRGETGWAAAGVLIVVAGMGVAAGLQSQQ